MKICYNASAMIANNALNKNDNRLTSSLQRLSSGLKIVTSKDNPAGMAMGKRMDAQLKGLSVATQNSSDAISVIETADGALSEVHAILQRMNELAVKASTGTLDAVDRSTIESEIKQLKDEITRISSATQFNGQTLLDGTFDLKGYTSDPINAKVGYYSDAVVPGDYRINSLTVYFDGDGNVDYNHPSNVCVTGAGFPADAGVMSSQGNTIKITSPSNPDFEVNIKVTPTSSTTVPRTFTNLDLDITGIGAMTTQIGANEGQTLDIRIPIIALDEMGIENISMINANFASEAIESIKGAIQYVSSARSGLGAYQNRLDHSINSLDVTSENMTAAYSRIMDVDMAEEMTEYTTVQVIAQASMSMLAQANERPSQVLQLLQ